MPRTSPYHDVNSVDTAIRAVELWADGYVLLHEIGAVTKGRLDGLLVPVGFGASMMKRTGPKSWNRPGLIGVEIKLTRGDFLRGLKSGQYERYDSELSGLYVATSLSVCRTTEIPDGIGHLVVGLRDGPVCLCKRHPVFKEIAFGDERLWRVIFAMYETLKANRIREESETAAVLQRVGTLAGRRIFAALSEAEAQIRRSIKTYGQHS